VLGGDVTVGGTGLDGKKGILLGMKILTKGGIVNGNFSLESNMFNSSCISDYMGCPRLFYYSWVRRLRPKMEATPLSFGRAFHEALCEWYALEKTKSVEERIAAGLSKFEQLPSVITDDHRTRAWGESIFKQYVERYSSEAGETLHLEVKFRVEIGDRIYAGTMDRVERWGGKIYVDDHKTTKQLGLSFFDSYRPHPQIDGYCYACRELMGECSGAIINGISVAKNPKDRFMRFPSTRTESEIDNWKTTFTDATDGMLCCMGLKHYPQHTTYCTKWGSKCKFWELCVYGENEKYIEDNFVVEPLDTVEEVTKAKEMSV